MPSHHKQFLQGTRTDTGRPRRIERSRTRQIVTRHLFDQISQCKLHQGSLGSRLVDNDDTSSRSTCPTCSRQTRGRDRYEQTAPERGSSHASLDSELDVCLERSMDACAAACHPRNPGPPDCNSSGERCTHRIRAGLSPQLTVADRTIKDVDGRTVLLRGVNANGLNDYATNGTGLPTVTPLGRTDFAQMAALGFNVVRLNVAWSPPGTDPRCIRHCVRRPRPSSGRGCKRPRHLHRSRHASGCMGPVRPAPRATSRARLSWSRESAGTAHPSGQP